MQGHSDDQPELLDAESVAGHLLKSDSMFAFLAAHRHVLFPEEMFADLFPSQRGRPSVPAEVMASVITLQALHGLSDNETVDAVTFDLRWKAACGLPVTSGAFHSTTLTYWRRRLAASGRPNRIFEAVKAVVTETGVLAKKTRRVLDSTVLDDAVATQDTVTQLIAAIRRVGREVPGAGEVITAQCTAHDYADPGKPAIAWNDKAARDQLVDGLVSDAHRLLGHLPEQELGPRAAEAIALLALVAGQDVEPVEGSDGTDGHWRIAQQVAPDRVISTVDPEARHAHKTVHRRQDGFKAHIAVEPDTGIITDCALTKASGSDNHEAVIGLALLAQEATPVRVLGDSAYGTGETRAALAELKHVAVIKPMPLRAAVPGGFTIDDFAVDLTEGTLTCPAGLTRTITSAGNVVFGAACAGCCLRSRCTTAVKGKTAKISPHHALQQSARKQSRNTRWLNEY
ncbi:IS1182 family transposase, partial [Mycobacterium sp. NAZ190054]|uniref:IS1182 family transposase n=1 Tax=Mycobacterium sp. NAZ190054 TaxID=1747766 RepID=UPI00079C1FE0